MDFDRDILSGRVESDILSEEPKMGRIRATSAIDDARGQYQKTWLASFVIVNVQPDNYSRKFV